MPNDRRTNPSAIITKCQIIDMPTALEATISLPSTCSNDGGMISLFRHIDLLRESIRRVKQKYPFTIHGWVVLPDHLHCVIELPEDDTNFPLRWRLIKMGFSKSLPKTERLSSVRKRRHSNSTHYPNINGLPQTKTVGAGAAPYLAWCFSRN